MKKTRFLLMIVLPILAGNVACAPPSDPPAETTPAPPPNVVIVLVDTLRADHMRLYGYERPTTPFIGHFASEAVVFEHARSQAPCTFPSVNSLLTSRYPGVFTRQEKGQLGIPEDTPSIAEILSAVGYNTIAVSASPIVRATPSDYNPNGGFDRGFDTFVEGCVWRHGTCVNKRVFDQLDLAKAPFFMYIHYMEPHAPYLPPDNYSRRFAGEYDGCDFIARGDPNPIADMLYDDGPELDLTDRDIQHLVDLYDDEIRYFDLVFRRLVGRLGDQGLIDNTVIVLAADHGEEFLEHGHVKHCRGVWNTVTHVPLIIRLPGMKEGRRVSAAVENVDIVHTLLDYLGVDAGGAKLEGSSLRPLIEGHDGIGRRAFAEAGRYRSVDDGRFHLIVDFKARASSLFDLRADELEQSDLFHESHPEVGLLTTSLNSWLSATGQRFRIDETMAAAKAKEDELRALGYLQ